MIKKHCIYDSRYNRVLHARNETRAYSYASSYMAFNDTL